MKRRWLKRSAMAGALGVAAGVVYWALAQAAPPPLAGVFPTGALVYLEARNFAAIAGDWDASREKAAWLGSADYQAFSRSALFLKLGEAQTDFAKAAGVPPDYALLKAVAGANSAIGIYNIGRLEFLYVTRMPSARAFATDLWKARGSYQTRRAGGVDFYVREDAGVKRTAAFAYAGDVLMLATREDLIAGALELLAAQGRPSLAGEKWFGDATQAAGAAGELRLVYNVDGLEKAPQFRSHWVQRNAAELKEFAAGAADLERSSGEVRERRVLLRAKATAAVADESAVGQAMASVPDDAGFYRARLRPEAGEAERALEEKIFAATLAPAPRNNFAPAAATERDAGSEQQLETRIDEPAITDDRTARAFTGLRERLGAMKLRAMVEIGSTRVAGDQVFVGSQNAVALLAESNWDADAMRRALSAAAGGMWSDGELGAGWRAAASGVQELDGLGRVAAAIDGRWLIVGNSAELVGAIYARRNRAAAAGAVYAAEWRHARELPNFERMMKLIDFPQMNAGNAPPGTNAREPMFYSENLASMGRVLERVQTASIAVHDAGAMLRETVVYRLAP